MFIPWAVSSMIGFYCLHCRTGIPRETYPSPLQQLGVLAGRRCPGGTLGHRHLLAPRRGQGTLIGMEV